MKREYEKVWFISERKFLFELFLPQNCLIHFWLHFVQICNPFIRVREIGIWCTYFFCVNLTRNKILMILKDFQIQLVIYTF